MSLVWAPVWNAGTCRPESDTRDRVARGRAPRGGEPQGVEYRSRGTGADRLVVAVMPGNAGGAKGAGHLWTGIDGQPERPEGTR